MKTIPLTQGKVAVVDDEDFVELSQYKWHARQIDNTFYATRQPPRNGSATRPPAILMHQSIMSAPRGSCIDHINHNGLDNRRENLRIVTTTQNAQNQRSRTGSSRFKGVYWHKGAQKWIARIVINGQKTYLGSFVDEVAAANAYNIAASQHYGEYAYLNVVAEEALQRQKGEKRCHQNIGS